MKPLKKSDTLEIKTKKAQAIKDLTEGLDNFTNYLATEFKKTQNELHQFKHGLHKSQKRLEAFRESGNRKIYE